MNVAPWVFAPRGFSSYPHLNGSLGPNVLCGIEQRHLAAALGVMTGLSKLIVRAASGMLNTQRALQTSPGAAFFVYADILMCYASFVRAVRNCASLRGDSKERERRTVTPHTPTYRGITGQARERHR